MPKSTVEPINSSKNKLNNKIILIFNFNPNAHLIELFVYILKNVHLLFPRNYT